MAGMLLIISGPSGAGKTTIARRIEQAFDDARFSVSVTTRPKTPKDREGIDYRFVREEEFQRMIDAGELLEWAQVFDHRYGTPRSPVEQTLHEGGLMILEIDVRGARIVKQKIPDAFGVFILPPGREALLDRLRARKREDEEIIQRRFREAQREIADAQEGGVYDVFIVNDDLEKAVALTHAVVQAERARRPCKNASPFGTSA